MIIGRCCDYLSPRQDSPSHHIPTPAPTGHEPLPQKPTRARTLAVALLGADQLALTVLPQAAKRILNLIEVFHYTFDVRFHIMRAENV